jgi:hypothetical protein
MSLELWLMLGFAIKHFIADFPLQRPFMYLNKGTLWHVGGIVHAEIHGLGTTLVLVSCGISGLPCLLLSLLDSVIHYFVDLIKVKINKHYELKPDNSEWYWVLLGLDQLLHLLTYVGIAYLVVAYA